MVHTIQNNYNQYCTMAKLEARFVNPKLFMAIHGLA
jgi:hypothetical protein